jgi:hypothetical protein
VELNEIPLGVDPTRNTGFSVANDFRFPTGESGGEISVDEWADGDSIVGGGQEVDFGSTAHGHIVVSVAVEIADGEIENRIEPRHRQIGTKRERAIAETLEPGNSAIRVSNDHIGDRTTDDVGDASDDRFIGSAGISGRCHKFVAAVSDKYQEFIGSRRHGDQIGREIRIEEPGIEPHSGGGRRRERTGGSRRDAIREYELAGGVSLEVVDRIRPLHDEIGERVGIDERQFQPIQRPEPELCRLPRGPVIVIAIERDGDRTIGAEGDEVISVSGVDDTDLDLDGIGTGREVVHGIGGHGQHLPWFEHFELRLPVLTLAEPFPSAFVG